MGDISSPNEADISSAKGNGLKITVVVAGKKGSGKSTLLNNIIRLSKEEVKPTKEVTEYNEKVDCIELNVIDLPGFGGIAQTDDERHDIMAQLIVTVNEADILLYCANVWGGIGNTDVEILRLFRMVFGKRLFQHCILVNTFANTIQIQEQSNRDEKSLQQIFWLL